ncbi:hypothetical protein [Candidatus Thalassolituus haligoni]|uniref:hypothetical protein n=1 Tax=Candidatus Thalassolituus haligoni TaxID=3100113 RepID=UPI00351547BB|tara:strand:+ start:7904 stop:8167 length:264 start_codon:yes stop_codon:yes gene_type:complete
MASTSSLWSKPIVRDLALILVLKLALIFTLRALFFSQPVDLSDPQAALLQQLGNGEEHVSPARPATEFSLPQHSTERSTALPLEDQP